MLRGRGAGDEGWVGGGGRLGARKEGWKGSEGERLDTKLPKSKKTNPNPILPTPPQLLLHTSYPIFLTPNQSPHINNTHSPNHPIGFLQKQRLYQPTNRAHKALSTPLPPTISPLLSHPPSSHTLKPSLSNPPFQRVKTYGNSSIQNHPIHTIPSNHLFHPDAIYFAMKIS